jgi:alkanesulfonate monooxygenase SsuD/methylene tetrahydromethanopterin reductase-like flavin-dependent oxidoreductase (luciferase family)
MRRVSIQTPPERTDFAALKDFWQAADGLGFHSAYTFDHLVPLFPGEGPGFSPVGERSGGQLDGWMAASALAAVTQRLLIGTLVSDATLREPALLAKMAVSLDHVSGGRAVLGVGAGWHQTEHHMFGIPFPKPAERIQRLAETLEMSRLLMRSEGPVSYRGRYFTLNGAHFDPKPVHGMVPIMIGGASPKVKRLAAEHANILNTFAPADAWPKLNTELDALLADYGRRPSELRRSAYVFTEISGVPDREDRLASTVADRSGVPLDEAKRRIITANPIQAASVLTRLFAAGVDEVVLGLTAPYDAIALARFAADVVPAVARWP